MHNKNIYLKRTVLGLAILIITLLLGYLKSLNILNNYSTQLTVYVIKIRTTTKDTTQNIKYGLESLFQAPTYKMKYLTINSKYQTCITTLHSMEDNKEKTSNQSHTLTLLALNWPDYGLFAITNSVKTKLSEGSIIVDKYNNFLGIVLNSYNYMAICKSLYVNDIKLSVYIKQAKAYGILEKKHGHMTISDISILHTIKKGYEIYLLDARFPTNIKIGKIDKVFKTPQGATQTAYLKPVYKLQDLKAVTNIKVINPQKTY